ncbi:MAG: glycyl-tRNA synthetase, glycyl-tRNA synthetase [Parcubacteria group bacterium GW2011_GWC1_39_29]|nr:MAG: glycyl-tRNA synthetase, glycyl-tRNA synthetase [Parcubacteria group bacterium GW2011_GWC1_39_29]
METNIETMEKIMNLCKRRGFVFPSSEIYGGFAATYDFGQVGMLLKKNLENLWRYWNVASRTDMVEIEGAIFMHPKTWEASGHVGGFADTLVEDLVTHKRYRADHLIEDAGIMANTGGLSLDEIDKVITENKLKSPDGNNLSKAKKFNMMVKTHLGAVEDETTLVYLKGESCQNIYLDWKMVQETSRRKLPFGIAQIGKAFRNEITVKSFLLRTRELEQMDVQYFCKPSDAPKFYQEWKQYHWDYYTKFLGIDESRLRWRQHEKDEKAFYATDAWDIEYNMKGLGFKELEGLHDRGSYDLDQHSKFSGQDLTYFDQDSGERFNPYIVECSAGFGRLFLTVMFEFYKEDVIDGEERIVLSFPEKIAPIKFAILPLSKKEELSKFAQEIFSGFRKRGYSCEYDETGSIGKRYRRQDEIGTPYCITVDFDSLTDKKVTIRNRDTTKQERVSLEELSKFVEQKFGTFVS